MNDLLGFVVLGVSIAMMLHFGSTGWTLHQRARDKDVKERYGRELVWFIEGMAYLHFTVAVVPFSWFTIIFMSAVATAGGGEWPVVAAVIVYALMGIGAVLGHRRWWGRIAGTDIVAGPPDNDGGSVEKE